MQRPMAFLLRQKTNPSTSRTNIQTYHLVTKISTNCKDGNIHYLSDSQHWKDTFQSHSENRHCTFSKHTIFISSSLKSKQTSVPWIDSRLLTSKWLCILCLGKRLKFSLRKLTREYKFSTSRRLRLLYHTVGTQGQALILLSKVTHNLKAICHDPSVFNRFSPSYSVFMTMIQQAAYLTPTLQNWTSLGHTTNLSLLVFLPPPQNAGPPPAANAENCYLPSTAGQIGAVSLKPSIPSGKLGIQHQQASKYISQTSLS